MLHNLSKNKTNKDKKKKKMNTIMQCTIKLCGKKITMKKKKIKKNKKKNNKKWLLLFQTILVGTNLLVLQRPLAFSTANFFFIYIIIIFLAPRETKKAACISLVHLKLRHTASKCNPYIQAVTGQTEKIQRTAACSLNLQALDEMQRSTMVVQ